MFHSSVFAAVYARTRALPDYIMLALYSAVSPGIGWWCARRRRASASDYFPGGGRALAASCGFLLLAPFLAADVAMPAIFSDRMVLQRASAAPVWGRAEPGEPVSVSVAAATARATADAGGRWRVELDTSGLPAGPHALTVTGKNKITIRDVLIGEVWLASGQSNMEWTLGKTYDWPYEKLAARPEQVRQFRVKKNVSDAPLEDCEGAWMSAASPRAGDFTATGYFFARDLHRVLGAPVGIINSSFGGSPIESWIAPATYDENKNHPVFSRVRANWEQALAVYPERKQKYDAELEAWNAEKSGAARAGLPFAKRAPGVPRGPGHHDTPAGL
jgi:sialate O-acetylesterase